MQLTVDGPAAQAGLAQLLAGAGTAPVDTRFTVQGGAIQVAAPGTDGQSCCADGAGALIEKALFGGRLPDPAGPAARPAPPHRAAPDTRPTWCPSSASPRSSARSAPPTTLASPV